MNLITLIITIAIGAFVIRGLIALLLGIIAHISDKRRGL